MNKKFAIGICAAVIVLSGALGYFLWATKHSDQAKVIEIVKNSLNDPDSAKFYNVKYFPETGGGCGEVNAKNRLGGYAGKKDFVATKSGDVFFAPEALDNNNDLASTEDKIKSLLKQREFYVFYLTICPEKDTQNK